MGMITPLSNVVRPISTSISTFAKAHPAATKVATVGLAGGAAVAMIACDPPTRDSASLGAELINKYDRNGDGRLQIDMEGTRDVARSEVECLFPEDVNGDGMILPDECRFPTTRTWTEKYSIEPLLREANRQDIDGDSNVAVIDEVEAVMLRYDVHGEEKKTPADGRLQGDEQNRFQKDWGEKRISNGR